MVRWTRRPASLALSSVRQSPSWTSSAYQVRTRAGLEPAVCHFAHVDRAHAELEDLLDAGVIQHPARDAGVAVGRALVLVAQVAVGVDLHHGERSPQGLQQAAIDARADRVLATERDHQLAGGRAPRDRLGDLLHARSADAPTRLSAGSVWMP